MLLNINTNKTLYTSNFQLKYKLIYKGNFYLTIVLPGICEIHLALILCLELPLNLTYISLELCLQEVGEAIFADFLHPA